VVAPGREPAGRGPGGVDRGAAGSPDRARGTQRAAMVPSQTCHRPAGSFCYTPGSRRGSTTPGWEPGHGSIRDTLLSANTVTAGLDAVGMVGPAHVAGVPHTGDRGPRHAPFPAAMSRPHRMARAAQPRHGPPPVLEPPREVYLHLHSNLAGNTLATFGPAKHPATGPNLQRPGDFTHDRTGRGVSDLPGYGASWPGAYSRRCRRAVTAPHVRLGVQVRRRSTARTRAGGGGAGSGRARWRACSPARSRSGRG